MSEIRNYASTFFVDMPVSYREMGSSTWHDGTVTAVDEQTNVINVKVKGESSIRLIDFEVRENRSRVLAKLFPALKETEVPAEAPVEMPRKKLPDPVYVQDDPSPYAGTTELPPQAGQREEVVTHPAEHRPGGMLNGALVSIRHSSWHGRNITTGRVISFVSVPAPHVVVRLREGGKRIIFCSAVEYIDEVPG